MTLADGRDLDGAGLYTHLSRELAPPAIPLFVRLGDGATRLTETYKLAMADLARDGYSPERVADPLYVLDVAAERYVALTPEALARLRLPLPVAEHDAGGNRG